MKQKVLSLAISIAMILSIIPFISVDSSAVSDDAIPPALTKIEASSQTVESGDSFTITVYANDPSGIELDRSSIVLVREQGDGDAYITQRAYLSDKRNGKYTATFQVNDDWEQGEYSIYELRLTDTLGNYKYYYNDSYMDVDNIISDSIFTVSTKNKDAIPPALTKIEASSQTVESGDSFTITVYANDPSGIELDRSSIVLVREQGDGDAYITQRAYLSDKGNGKYTATFQVNDDWISGKYSIYELRLTDTLGNYKYYYNDSYMDVDNIISDSIFTVSKSIKPSESPKPSETVKPSESPKPSETVKPSESPKPSETVKPSESPKPSETVKPSESPKPSETVKPSESPKPSETVKPSESPKPSETVKPSESPKPSETVKPSESPKPSETVKPSESPKPSETVKPSESPKPSETVKPSESPKPSETVKPSESPKPVDPVIPDDHSDNCPSKPYSDMKNTEGKWFHEGVDYAISNGYMTGVENNLFAPNRAVSRAMVAQILYAAEGKPAVTKSAGFSDVKAGKWYTDAVNWAASKGVVAGYPDGSFKPDKAVTREELATILYKYAQTKTDAFGIAMDALDKFQDKKQIHAYAVNAMEWAVTNKIISGTDQGLEPRGTATRAQLAVMLQAFDNTINK